MKIHCSLRNVAVLLITVVLLGTVPIAIWAQSDQVVPVFSLAWKPDATRLAVTTLDRLQIYDQNLQLVQERPLDGRTISSVHWSPDGKKLIVGRQIWNAETFDVLVTIETEVNLGGWSKDSAQVWTLAPNSRGVAIFDAISGSLIKTVSSGETLIMGAEWSPDDSRFATAFHALNTLVILDVSSGEISTAYPLTVSPGPLTWSPDSTRLASATMKEVAQGTPGSVPSASGSVLFELYVWDAATGQVLNHFSGLPEYLHRLRWHPNGVELAGAAANGAIYVWDTVTNQQVDYFLSSGVITSMEYSPFGGRLAVGTNPAQLEFMSPGRRVAPDTLKFVQRVPGSTVELFVPSPSIQDVEYIMEACNVAVEVRQAITERAESSEQSTLAAYLGSLRNNQISSGCAAELIAVAEALQ